MAGGAPARALVPALRTRSLTAAHVFATFAQQLRKARWEQWKGEAYVQSVLLFAAR